MPAAAALIVLSLAGCGQLGPADPAESDNRAETAEALALEMGWRPDAFVTDDLGLAAYASRVRAGTLEIIGIELMGSEWHATSGGSWGDIGGTNTVSLGEGLRGGTIIYGSAEPAVAKVVTDAPGARGGVVTDGGWVVWSPDASLLEADGTVAWSFVEEDGSPVDEGTGWRWPLGTPFDLAPPTP